MRRGRQRVARPHRGRRPARCAPDRPALVPGAPASAATEAPTLEAFEWLPRGSDEAGTPVLRLALPVNAPRRLTGGVVTVKAFHYQNVDTGAIPAQDAGTHDLVVDIVPNRVSHVALRG